MYMNSTITQSLNIMRRPVVYMAWHDVIENIMILGYASHAATATQDVRSRDDEFTREVYYY